MGFLDEFKKTIAVLESTKVQYAVAGGIIASVYRSEIRATEDIDIVIFSEDKASEFVAENILEQLNLEPRKVRKAELEGGPMFAIKSQSTPVWLLVGRKKNQVGVDFLLENIPWVKEAVKRAKKNKIDFGFGLVPCITVEDLIISKCFSFYNQSTRLKDLDDLTSVLKKNKDVDFVYIAKRFQELKLKIPDAIKDFVPKQLVRK